MGKLRVLIVEDEVALLCVLRRGLSRRYDVETAETGGAALALIRGVEFDAIVCDLHLGDMEGSALLETVTRERPELRARFLFCSGGSTCGTELAFLESVPTIAKPCTPDDVAAMVEQLGGCRR